jgi:hypothetical protein
MAGQLNLSALRSGCPLPGAAAPPPPASPVGFTPPPLRLVQGTGTDTFTLNGVPRC